VTRRPARHNRRRSAAGVDAARDRSCPAGRRRTVQ
jgi:hypothetical protein